MGGGGGGERVKFYSKVTFCDVMQNVHGSMLYIRVDYQQFKIKEGQGRGGGGGHLNRSTLHTPMHWR